MNWLKAVGWNGVSITDVLMVEMQYPGLWEDLAVEHWQRGLVAKLLKEQSGEKANGKADDPDGLIMKHLVSLQ